MPNWCTTVVSVSGKKDKVEAMFERLATQEPTSYSEFSLLEAYLPEPAELSGNEAANWRGENWGCNGDIGSDLQKGARGFSFVLRTPWATPTTGLVTISKMLDVQIVSKWSEPWACIRGHLNVRSGQVLFDREFKTRRWW